MYLTRFEINPSRRGAKDLLSSPHRMHAAVMRAFPADYRDATDTGRVLWRVDQRGNQTLLYLTSPAEPDLTHLVEDAGWPTTQRHWDTKPYEPLLTRLAAGQRWAFRLTANPVRTAPPSPGKPSRRLGHVTVAQQLDWLLTRAGTHGFAVPDTSHKEPDATIRGRRIWRFDRQGRTVTLSTAVFEGFLDVTDPAALRHALTHGIGPAKGYGCGLMTLAAPITSNQPGRHSIHMTT